MSNVAQEATESLNINRMQLYLSNKLITSNGFSAASLTEYLAAARELDNRVSAMSKTNVGAENVREFQSKQSNIWRILNNTTTSELHVKDGDYDENEIANADNNKTTTAASNSVGNTNSQITNSLHQKTGKAVIRNEEEVRIAGSMVESYPRPGDDISSASDIQTLLLQQKDISAREREQEEKTQDQLTNELLNLTSLLKENTMMMSETICMQNSQLAEMYGHAEDNVEELVGQKDKMNKQTELQSSSLWTTLYALVTVFVSFSLTYAVIRIFPKP